jgi:formylglycine-generating enzyme required for sulfatase activity/serine/threonine protein kinase
MSPSPVRDTDAVEEIAMSEEARFHALRERWEAARQFGTPLSAEELCHDCPELRDAIRRKLAEWELDDACRVSAWQLPLDEPVPQRASDYEGDGLLVLVAGLEPVPGYRLHRRLGKGSFGEVWAATGPGDVAVALKFISLDAAAQHFESRALGLMKHLRHPNLLTVSGVWQSQALLIIALDLADGTLRDRLYECRSQGLPGIPGPELLEYMREAAKGIDFLNEPRHTVDGRSGVSILHRDIKPANLLLVGGGLKVGDFGLAKLLENAAASNTGAMTIAYAAPECFQNRTTRHSDQYSLAVTWCELRGGRLPFQGSFESVMAGHVSRPPDLSMLPAAERPAVAKALAKGPDERWSNCRAFVEALAALGSFQGRSPAPEVAVAPPPAREQVPTQACSVTVLEVPSSPQGAWVPNEFRTETETQPARAPWALLFGAVGLLALVGVLVLVLLPLREREVGPDPPPPLQLQAEIKAEALAKKKAEDEALAQKQAEAGALAQKQAEAVALAQKQAQAAEAALKKAKAEAAALAQKVAAAEALAKKQAEAARAQKQAQAEALAQAQAEEADRQARTLVRENQDYEGAVRLLEGVPSSRRDLDFYQEIRARRDRARQLDRDLRTALKAKDWYTVREKLDALLVLQPRREEELQTVRELLPRFEQTAKYVINSIDLRLARIPKGKFLMGSPPDEPKRKADEDQHEVAFGQSFYLGAFEVTQSQYRRVMGKNPSNFAPGGDGRKLVAGRDTEDFPVDSVSWYDATEFCRRLSALPAENEAGRVYHLPTEAEWEYACRAGKASTFHHGPTLTIMQANFFGKLGRTEKVGAYRAYVNDFGLHDMHGNVREWTADRYGPYALGPQKDPTGSPDGKQRVLRGGSWSNDAASCRAAARHKSDPENRFIDFGFRVVIRLGPRAP